MNNKVEANRFKTEAAWVAFLVKKELKERFPGVRFSVKSSVFAGGDSVDVRYDYGKNSPDIQAVNAILNKYKAGQFDGMTDCYEYRSGVKGPTAKYLFAQRDYPTSVRDVVYAAMREQGRMSASPQEWQNALNSELVAQGF